MALSRPPGSEGQRLSHLRSIGSWAPVPGASQVIHFSKAITLFGRNLQVVDYCLNSPAATTDLNYISRIHARIIRADGEYVLVDSSLTGVYVNDSRIEGRVNLREGDTVTFGHPAGKNLLPGSHARQPNSPFYFLFEHCDCCPDQMQSVGGDRRTFPQLLKGPDLVSAGVSHPGHPNLPFAHRTSRPQMPRPGELAGSVTRCDPPAALAPPPKPALSASSPVAAPLPTPPQKRPEQSRLPSSSCPPLRAPCRRASGVLRSASPDYAPADGNSSAATDSSPLQEKPEPGDSVSRSGSESAVEHDTPHPQPWCPRDDAGSDPGRGRAHPLLPGPTRSEVSEAADRGGSPKAVEASGPWEETLRLTPVVPMETGGDSGCVPSVFGPESPALSETDQEEERAKMNLGPSMEETACLGESLASEPGSPVEGMEGVELAGSPARVRSSSVEGCQENLVEEHPPQGASEEEEEEAEGVGSRTAGLSSEIQASESGPIQQRDSAEISFTSGGEPTNGFSTQIFSREKLDSERRIALLPPRNSSRGTQGGAADDTADSPQKVAASEDVEMEPATDDGSQGLDGHPGGGGREPARSSAVPAGAEGVCDEASRGHLSAELGMRTDGAKPGGMGAAAAESFKDVGPDQRMALDGADSKAPKAKEMLLQELPDSPVLNEQFKGRFPQGERKDRREAPETTGGGLHAKDPPETREQGGRVLGTDVLPAVGTPVPEPPENLGKGISELRLFQSSKTLLENQAGEGSVTGGKSDGEHPRSAGSCHNLGEATAGARLQDGDEGSEGDGTSLGMVDVPVAGSAGGEPPSYKSGRPRQGDPKDPPSEEESELQRGAIGTSAETDEDAADQPREAEGGLEEEASGLVGQQEAGGSAADADPSLTRSPSPDPAERWSSVSAGRKGDSPRDGPEDGRIPHLGECSLEGPQPPPPKSPREAGERAVPDRNPLLSGQHVPEEGPAKTPGEEEEEEEAGPVANVPSAATEMDFDPSPGQVGALNGPGGVFSSGSSCAINQRLAEVDPQELKSDIVEPENLENGLEVKPQGADGGGKLLCLEDPLIRGRAAEEPEAPVEQISPPVPGEPGQDVLLPKESDGLGRITKDPHCMKAEGSTPLPLPGVGLPQPGDVAVKLPAEPTDDSEEPLQLPGGEDGFRGQIPASEAEKEETDQCGPSKADGLRGGQTAKVTERKEAFSKEPTEESAARRPGHLAIQGARAGPPRDTEMLEMLNLEGQTSSRGDSPGRAASSTAGTEAGEPPLSRKSRKRASEAPEEPGGEEMELEPVHLASRPEKPPSESASGPAEDGTVACKDQGFVENAGRGWAQGRSRPLAGRPPAQADAATGASPPGEADQELPGSETPSSPCSGEGGRAQKAGLVHWDAKRLPGQESGCQLGKGLEASAGSREGLGCSESRAALLQGAEKANSSSPRKRPQEEGLDSEGAACQPKKPCGEDSASLRGPGVIQRHLLWCHRRLLFLL